MTIGTGAHGHRLCRHFSIVRPPLAANPAIARYGGGGDGSDGNDGLSSISANKQQSKRLKLGDHDPSRPAGRQQRGHDSGGFN